jgi:predicted ATPase
VNFISVRNLGQLFQADIQLGDLTVLVGPQASAKSIFLQILKLTLDSPQIARTIRQNGFYWDKKPENFLSLYLGEGMQKVWASKTSVSIDGKHFELSDYTETRGRKKQDEKLFLIPAQRVITLRGGWPRPFTDYDSGDPYVVKQFSEQLRRLMETGLGGGKGAIFPQEGRFNKDLRNAISQTIFSNAEVRLDTREMRKRLILKVGENELPFMVWSAGQREFIPLLLGLYALMPSSGAAKKPALDWVVIEEPEMGLHPQAISTLLILFLELINRGYRVIVSTHSPQILEMVWAIRTLQKIKSSPDNILKIFNLHKSAYLQKMSETVIKKTYQTYYFDRQQEAVNVRNISTLDPYDDEPAVSDWGGLTDFSTRVSTIVSQAVQEKEG